MNQDRPVPLAIGGVGGSGPRLVAFLIEATGFHIGDDLNPTKDMQPSKRTPHNDCPSDGFVPGDLVFVRSLGCQVDDSLTKRP